MGTSPAPLVSILRERYEAAKAKMVECQQRATAATAALNLATAEHNIWVNALNLEVREEEKRAAAMLEMQPKLPEMEEQADADSHQTEDDEPEQEEPDHSEDAEPVNKTDLVRSALKATPKGMTPAAIWLALQKDISSRPYLYSILKRLRDKEEVVLRRGKYILKPKAIEPQAGTEEKEESRQEEKAASASSLEGN